MRRGIVRGAAAAFAVAGVLAVGLPAMACPMMGAGGNAQAQAGTQAAATTAPAVALAVATPTPAAVQAPAPPATVATRTGFWSRVERALVRGWNGFLASMTQTLRAPLAFRPMF